MANYSILFLLPALNMDVTVRKPWEREVIKFDQVKFSPYIDSKETLLIL